jgi:hypothetical protein
VLSDFLLPPDSYKRDLLMTSQRHETVAIVLSDPLEESFPEVGLMGLRDSETDTVEWVDTSSDEWQRRFSHKNQRLMRERDDSLQQATVERIDIPPEGVFGRALIYFFERQAKRRRR